MDLLDTKSSATSYIRYNRPSRIYEVSDLNKMLKSLLPNELKVKYTMAVIRLRSDLTTNKTINFTEKTFFYTILGFTQSYSGVLGDIEAFIQKLLGNHRSERPINITGFDKIVLKCDVTIGSFVNYIRKLFMFSSCI